MHVETYPAFFTPRGKKFSHSSSEETSSEFDLLEIKIMRKQKYQGKTEQVLCKIYFLIWSSSHGLHILDLSWYFFTLVQRYIYRRYFLRNIPIISLAYYKEKIEIYKISWEKI